MWPDGRAIKVLAGAVALQGVAALIIGVIVVASLAPPPRGAMSWRDPVAVDQLLRTLTRESQWPMVWIGEICDGPLYQLRGRQQVGNATYAAACRSRVTPSGDVDTLIVARYATEVLVQQDLHQQGYTFYTLREWGGALFMAATRSDETAVDAHGHDVPPSLQPLEVFGLPIFRGPGWQ